MKSSFWFWAFIALLVYVVAKNEADPVVEHPRRGREAPLVLPEPTNTFKQLDPTAQPVLTYKGYECTVDCSGHEAGYEWAENEGIDDPDDCGGNSQSFIEGCRAYAEEQQAELFDEEGGIE